MKKIILATVSGLALMGLAACSDTETPAEGVDSTAPATTMEDPAAAPADTTTPPASTDSAAPADPAE